MCSRGSSRRRVLRGHCATPRRPAAWTCCSGSPPSRQRPSRRCGPRTLPPDRYPAFRRQHAAPDPPDATPAALLLARLTALRYLRADAHAAAWATAGLDAAQIGALTALLRGTIPSWDGVDAALERLQHRGQAAHDGTTWHLTERGRAEREAIEADTNERAAPPWAALTATERAALLHGLARLPD
jgi:hypothetical protein